MSYCPNPRCGDRINPTPSSTPSIDDHCQHCHTPLLLQQRYRLVRPLRELNEWEAVDVFEVHDINAAEKGNAKVLKLLKDKRFQESFKRESDTLQRVHHDGIPQVEPDGYFRCEIAGRDVYCLVMEKIEGTNLADWLQHNSPIDQPTAIAWLHQLIDILGQLHDQELFHRDIKLPNIMLRPTGQLALVDFGAVRPLTNTYLAKVAVDRSKKTGLQETGLGETMAGKAGMREVTSVVSPGYTPAEQVDGRAVPQSDFYSLGRSLIHLLTGEHPIDLPKNETTGTLVWRHKVSHPLDQWLMDLLDHMMAPFPGQRPANATMVKERLQSGKPQGQKQNTVDWLVVVNVGVFLLQLSLAGWHFGGPSNRPDPAVKPLSYHLYHSAVALKLTEHSADR